VLKRRREAELHDARSGALHKRIATLASVLSAHDPDRVLERGYAVVSDAAGQLVSSAAGARAAGRIDVRFADDDVEAEVIDSG
jgi:exodeoxyribonuclease VII large subunit